MFSFFFNISINILKLNFIIFNIPPPNSQEPKNISFEHLYQGLVTNYYTTLHGSFLFMISIQLFVVGLVGLFFSRRHFLSMLMSIEIMYLSIGLNFVASSLLKFSYVNYAVPLLVLAVSACEAAIGLSLLVMMHKYGWNTENFLASFSAPLSRKLPSTYVNSCCLSFIFFNCIFDNNNILLFLNSFINHLSNSVLGLFKGSILLTTSYLNYEYLSVLYFFISALFLLVLLLVVSRLIAKSSPQVQKLSSYECGFEPFSDARGKQDILFYVVAILFILFDVELIFLFPWALTFTSLDYLSHLLIFFFISTLLLGFAYEWRNGALNWVIDQK